MAANNENIWVPEKSKKIVKRDKMPANRRDEENGHSSTREPLRTLSNQNQLNIDLAGPSQNSKVLETRHVTYRSNTEELDWKFEVFKDLKDHKDSSTSKESIKHSLKEHATKHLKVVEEKQERHENRKQSESPNVKEDVSLLLNTAASEVFDRNCLDPNIYKVTPNIILKSPNEEALRRVKLSLKIPVRRSEGARSPAPVSAKSYHQTIFSCKDIKDPTPRPRDPIDHLNRDYIQDNLYYLQQMEKRIEVQPNIRSASRSCVINWIINVNGTNGSPLVVQTACWYMDFYLSTTTVAVERLQLIAAACFWIAAKLHGRHISGRRLVKYSGNAFLEKDLVATEKTVLRTMQFQALSVTAHDFVPYLSCWCDQSGSGVVEAAAVFLCQTALLIDKNLCREYPSVVAAAAVMNALVLLRQNAWIDKLRSCKIYQIAERKAPELNRLCMLMRETVRIVSSVGFEYKAPLFKYSGPPHHISSKIVRAVNYKDILAIDENERLNKRRTQ